LMWILIIKKCPEVKFLAFTKSEFVQEYLDILPKNLNLYWSVWGDSEEIVEELPKAFAGECDGSEGAVECSGRCDDCMHCFDKRENVRFKIH